MGNPVVQIMLRDGTTQEGEFALVDELPDAPRSVGLSLVSNVAHIEVIADDYFSALRAIRQRLEAEGMRVKCHGAERDVYVSPMSRDMGYGLYGHRIRLGQQAREEDRVPIFDAGPDTHPVTVQEQDDFYKRWLASLGAKRRGS